LMIGFSMTTSFGWLKRLAVAGHLIRQRRWNGKRLKNVDRTALMRSTLQNKRGYQ
jgi:hypothetical protein